MAFQFQKELLSLLAIEYNCNVSDLSGNENTLTVSALNEGRRNYGSEKYFFHMVTLGDNAVVTADERLHPFLHKFIKNRSGHWLFEIPNLLPLETELERFGYTLSQTHHMFLPSRSIAPVTREIPFEIKWLYGKEQISPFYGDARFPNAICSEYLPHRPDRIAVCAYDGDKIAGMAGCSEDAKCFMQIGIDVLPEYRSKGVGTYLVSILKNEIQENGDIPFYGTSVSNYHSWNIAINCGFRPAWVEIGANKIIPKEQ